MFECSKTLRKIEKLVESLPYQSVHIEIKIGEQTLTLEKERQKVIGFRVEKER